MHNSCHQNSCYILSSSCFLNKLSYKSVSKLRSCCKELKYYFEEECEQARRDVNIYTWERCYNMRITIWGRGWETELVNYLEDDYGEHEHNKDGSTTFHCSELLCQHDAVFDLLEEVYECCNWITGKKTACRHVLDCPDTTVEFYV